MKELIEIQSKLNAPKNKRNSFGNYNYRSCEDILEAVKPLLKATDCTLTLSDEMVAIGNRIYVKATATLSNNANESVTVFGWAREAETKKGMDDSQVTGATSSYARKYALNGLFAIDDNKDADTDEYQVQTQQPKAATKSTTKAAEKPIDGTDVVLMFQNCKSMDELKSIWSGLTDRMKKDPVIVKACQTANDRLKSQGL